MTVLQGSDQNHLPVDNLVFIFVLLYLVFKDPSSINHFSP